MVPRFSYGVLAVAAVFLFADAASAQFVPPTVRGFQRQQMMQRQQAAPSAPSPVYVPPVRNLQPAAPPADVQIAVNTPGVYNPPATVAIRGPDGVVRTYPVEGGQAALQNQVIVVRPGERVTVQFMPAPAPTPAPAPKP